MHETRFAGQILTVVKKNVPSRPPPRAVTVRVRLSPLCHVSPKNLKNAFEALVEREKVRIPVRLDIKVLEFDLLCKSCGKAARAGRPVFACPSCGNSDIEIKSSEEFVIDSVDFI